MLFKDLKNGFPVYIYDRNMIEVSQGKVINVSMPHMDKGNFNMQASMVVDITIDQKGNPTTYTFRDDTETGYTGSLVITTDKANIIREIEASKEQSEEALSQVEQHKHRIERYTSILADYNPAIKEKKEIDERFGKLENSMVELKHMLSSLVTNNTQQL